MGVSVRVSRARAVAARGRRPAVVALVAGISRQAIYRPVRRRPVKAGPGRGRPGDEAIVEVAKANPTDSTRMVAAIASRELDEPVNRKRVPIWSMSRRSRAGRAIGMVGQTLSHSGWWWRLRTSGRGRSGLLTP